ncbi:phage baseplate assembly protein V [Neolewinella antarctica]|uniref:Phage protein D n=1 Tax=Neolewinella antarctica TaxID=442734 RepID=A0ABX0X639_9BACT|nr:phage baseplate assembly protein V [Neolewinella antarctica]NJC24668.1 phage protein D [Neolewinella antarctica]
MKLLNNTLPTGSEATAPTCTVISNGKALPAEFILLSAVTDHAVDRVPTATLIFSDGSVAGRSFATSQSSQLKPGAAISVKMGYLGREIELFSGELTAQRIKVRSGGSELFITVKNLVYRLTLERRSRDFIGLTDTEAIEEILADNAIGYELSDLALAATPVVDLVQHHCTDWDWMITRGQAAGLVTIPNKDIVSIRVPALDKPVVDLIFGQNLLSFDAETNAQKHFKEYTATAYDTTSGKATSDTESADYVFGDEYSAQQLGGVHGPDNYQLRHGGPLPNAELTRAVTAAKAHSALSTVRGVAELVGATNINVGDTVELMGLGKVFNGLAYVSGVRQEMSPRGWSTFLQFGLETDRFAEAHATAPPAAAGLIPAAGGLHLGKVVALAGDPRGEDRIRVQFPAIDGEGEGRWSRLSTLSGGAGFGTIFRPSIGQQVIVGFLDDDPRYPVVLGSFHGSLQPAHHPATDANHLTSIRTEAGHEILIDDEQHLLQITGPKGERISLEGERGAINLRDRHGNEIRMDASGIKIASVGTLTLEARKDATITANGNIDLAASLKLTAKGEVGADYGSSGICTVKGALIQLN